MNNDTGTLQNEYTGIFEGKNLILEIDPNMRISISTNGTNLKEFLNFDNIDKLEGGLKLRCKYINMFDKETIYKLKKEDK